MHTSPSKTIVLTVGALAVGALLRAQAPIDLSGTWTFDTYLSDNAQQVAASIRADLGQNDSGLAGGVSEGGRVGRSAGRRGPAHAGRVTPAPNAEDQRVLDAITHPLRYPPPTLRIIQSSTTVTIRDPQGQSRAFQTNGKREQQMFDTARADSVARWEGPQMVVDIDLGNGRKLTYTYSIVPTTRQLLVRVTLERAPNQPGPFEIKFVYNRAA